MPKRTCFTLAQNLYNIVFEDGRSYYVIRYRDESGIRREKSLGSASSISLREAKQLARAYQTGQMEPAQAQSRKPAAPTFRRLFEKAFKAICEIKHWKNPRSSEQFYNSVRDYAFPVIGDLPLAAITHKHIMKILTPIWITKNETARKLQNRLETVFGWFILNDYMKGENPARWREYLCYLLPAKTKVHKVEHLEAPTLEELRKIVAFLLQHPCNGSGLILFIIATASRVSEASLARSEQIDRENKIWISPEENQKIARGDRLGPLSLLAQKAVGMGTTAGLLFRGKSGGKMSIDYPRLRMQLIVGRGVTAHGIRSTFRDWCAEHDVEEVIAEMCLSHVWGNATTQAYFRADLLEKRRAVLERWSSTLLQGL
ncbi:MAG: hypothetical protein IJ164_00175 [Duodenibacillus sp.]|nr:hypothetical protein [Duodenibacillus sp.]